MVQNTIEKLKQSVAELKAWYGTVRDGTQRLRRRIMGMINPLEIAQGRSFASQKPRGQAGRTARHRVQGHTPDVPSASGIT